MPRFFFPYCFALNITGCRFYYLNFLQMVESRFRELLSHSKYLLKKKWLFGILDDFITKQLPHNVTWLLSLLYAMEHKGDRASISTQGRIVGLFSVTLFISSCPPLTYAVLSYR